MENNFFRANKPCWSHMSWPILLNTLLRVLANTFQKSASTGVWTWITPLWKPELYQGAILATCLVRQKFDVIGYYKLRREILSFKNILFLTLRRHGVFVFGRNLLWTKFSTLILGTDVLILWTNFILNNFVFLNKYFYPYIWGRNSDSFCGSECICVICI